MKIFITGSTGFIGRHVVKLLSQRHHDLMMLIRNRECDLGEFEDSDRMRFIIGDLSNIDEWKQPLREFAPDVTLHLAWEGLPDYGAEVCRRNCKYGEELFAVVAQAGCRCILSAGSCWEYKRRQGELAEAAEIEVDKTFPAAKNALRLAGEAISKEYGMKFYWPRIFYAYGPGQRKASLIPYIISSLGDGVVPEIRNLNNKHDFVYVDDVAKAIVMMIEKQPDKIIYNIGSGYSVSVRNIISIVRKVKVMGIQSEFYDDSRESSGEMSDDFWADISRARDELGWSPMYSISDGVKEVIRYYTRCKAMEVK